MDYVGLTSKYKVDRPLTGKETDNHLLRSEPSRSKPLYQKRVIRMNSTYLECVDKFFIKKGFMSAVMLAVTGMIFVILVFLTWDVFLALMTKNSKKNFHTT
jgi:hypothetical protein